MELPSLVCLIKWVLGVAAEALKAWCGQYLRRRLGIDSPPAASVETIETSPPVDTPSDTPIDRLYETVARYRRGNHP